MEHLENQKVLKDERKHSQPCMKWRNQKLLTKMRKITSI